MSLTDKNNQSDPIAPTDQIHNDQEVTIEALLREKKSVASDRSIDEDRQEVTEQTIKERETMRIGQEKYFGLRDQWSWFIFVFVFLMLEFQLFLAIAIGFGWVDFTQYKTFLHLIVGENFAQIIGMGYIVAKYLFPNAKG